MEIYVNIDKYDNICKELNSNWCFLKFIFFVKKFSYITFFEPICAFNFEEWFYEKQLKSI